MFTARRTNWFVRPMSVNVVNNYYKPGPVTQARVRRRIARIDDNMARYKNFEPLWHIEGNVVEGAPELTADNWKGGVEFEGNTNEAKNRQRTAFPFAPVTTRKAMDAYKLVLADVGANRPVRDALDSRVLKEVADGTATCGERGIIDRQGEAGGWPLLQSSPAPADTDLTTIQHQAADTRLRSQRLATRVVHRTNQFGKRTVVLHAM